MWTQLDAWFTFTDFDRNAVMPRAEFTKAVEGLLKFSAEPKAPKSYISYDRYRADWLRHVRVEYERQHACKGAMTNSQEVGWHNIKPGASPTKGCAIGVIAAGSHWGGAVLKRGFRAHTRLCAQLCVGCVAVPRLCAGPRHHAHHLNATDVTKREGRTAASYYGHFLA